MSDIFGNESKTATSVESSNGFSGSDIPKTAFGEMLMGQLTPEIQISGMYGSNSDMYVQSGAGIIEFNHLESLFQISVDNSSEFAMIQSKRYVKYRVGQGVLIRFTCVFDTPNVDSKQEMGYGIPSRDFIGFGYYQTTEFGIIYRRDGITTFIPQSSWNLNTMDGLDPTKGNVYQMNLQWLGFGKLCFYIEDNSGDFIEVHRIKYANNYTQTSLLIPSAPITMYIENFSSISTIQMSCASMSAFIEGKKVIHGVEKSHFNEVVNIGAGTETLCSAIQVKSLYKTLANFIPVYPNSMSLASDSTKPVIFRVYLNPTITGGVYSDVATNSAVQYTDVGTVSGGEIIGVYLISATDSKIIDLKSLNIQLVRNDALAITAETGSNTNDIYTSLIWLEDF